MFSLFHEGKFMYLRKLDNTNSYVKLLKSHIRLKTL